MRCLKVIAALLMLLALNTAVCFAHPFAWFMADLILIPLYIALLSDKKQHHALQGQM